MATTITDEQMQEMRQHAQVYTLLILRFGPNRDMDGVEKIIWEHGRRNFSLRADGLLPIVCPATDRLDVAGIGIFSVGLDETREIMDGDPGVQAGVFVYDLHPCRGFPGDALPQL